MTHVKGIDDGAGYGVFGSSGSSTGVRGQSDSGDGVVDISGFGNGVRGTSFGYHGVAGYSTSREGVRGLNRLSQGVRGLSRLSQGVSGHSVMGHGLYASSIYGFAALLDGDVMITGNLLKAGGSFKIDHPLDPANKYLAHSFVESPDMKNIYDGVVILDDKGEAEIELPDWFGALNKDFRYQITAVGAPGANLYIAEEISEAITNYTSSNNNNNNNSRFKIAGGTSGMKVSWQVTGIRKDPWANAHRIQVEEDKPDKERGYYLYPDLYGQPEENGIRYLLFPQKEEKWQEEIINENKPNL